MRRAIATALLLTAVNGSQAAQNKPRRMQIEGAQARRLISLLVTGSDDIASSLRDSGSSRIVLHDLMVLKSSTYKYEKNAAMYDLDVYYANAKIGNAAQLTPVHEATPLYEFLSSLGVRNQLSMQGSDLDAETVDCRINTDVSFDKPQRFVCDLVLPF